MCHTDRDAVQQTALCFFRYVVPGSGLPEQFRPRRSWGRRSWVTMARNSQAAAACGDARKAGLYYDLSKDLFRAGQSVCGTDPRFLNIWLCAYERATGNFSG